MGIHETLLTLICELWDGNVVGKPLTADGLVIVLLLSISLAKYLRSIHFFVDMELHSHEMETAQLMSLVAQPGCGRAAYRES